MTTITNYMIAKVAHDVNKAYCATLGDHSQPTWENAPLWQQESALKGVHLHCTGDFGPQASHEAWAKEKLEAGWTYGQVKDEVAKTHPCLVDFADLPKEQQLKDTLFTAVVHSLRGELGRVDSFLEDVVAFNHMYGLPIAAAPTTALEPVVSRMTGFKKVLTDEVNEVDDIIAEGGKNELDDLVALADWLGDIIVYATSEAVRYGIPIYPTLAIIMASNFSKLGEDGKPIIANHKVQKGPNYWKPEPKLREMLMHFQGTLGAKDASEAATPV